MGQRSILFRNWTLIHFDPPGLEVASLRIEGARIAEVGADLSPRPGEAILEGRAGRILMPGLVNGHTHLWRAPGFGWAGEWNAGGAERFDALARAHSRETVVAAARAGAAAAALAGITTVFDHHCSPEAAAGALDAVSEGVASIGLRGILACEISDRFGTAARDATLEENRRWLSRCGAPRTETLPATFAGMVGLGEPAQCSDETLAAARGVIDAFGAAAHMHMIERAASDPADDARQWDRVDRAGLLRVGTLLGGMGGVGAGPGATEVFRRLRNQGAYVAYCPTASMVQEQGFTPVGMISGTTLLGTDGLAGGSVLGEARLSFAQARAGGWSHSIQETLYMMAVSARFASWCLGGRVGTLEPGAAADFVVADYDPPGPLEAANVGEHVLFGIGAGAIRETWVAGTPVVLEGRLTRVRAEDLAAQTREAAAHLRESMAGAR